MNSLKLTLLLSLAPFGLTASNGNCCDRTEAVCNESEVIQDEKCCNNLCELTVFKTEAAHDASIAYIGISSETISHENWELVRSVATDILDEATTQTENSLVFIFERKELSLEAWFELLAEVETKYAKIKETIEADQNCAGIVVELGLNK